MSFESGITLTTRRLTPRPFEAACAVARHAFDRNRSRIEPLAATGDVPSQGVAERAGFVREGVMRQALVVPGDRADAVLFSLLKEDRP